MPPTRVLTRISTLRTSTCTPTQTLTLRRYNISNKRVQNAFPMPWMMSLSSLFVGVPWVMLLWATGIRKAPEIKREGWKTLAPIGAAHAIGHAGSVIALGAGAVSFAQTVKAAEPVFTCVMSYLVLGTVFKWQVHAASSLRSTSPPPSPPHPSHPPSPTHLRLLIPSPSPTHLKLLVPSP